MNPPASSFTVAKMLTRLTSTLRVCWGRKPEARSQKAEVRASVARRRPHILASFPRLLASFLTPSPEPHGIDGRYRDWWEEFLRLWRGRAGRPACGRYLCTSLPVSDRHRDRDRKRISSGTRIPLSRSPYRCEFRIRAPCDSAPKRHTDQHLRRFAAPSRPRRAARLQAGSLPTWPSSARETAAAYRQTFPSIPPLRSMIVLLRQFLQACEAAAAGRAPPRTNGGNAGGPDRLRPGIRTR